MATIRTLSQLLAELPDNTSRMIHPADSRDIAATAFGYVGGTDPTVNNDSADTAGLGAFFDMGSRWYNSALNRLWICLTGIPTAAVWAQITGPAGPPGPSGPVSFPPSSGMSPEDGEDALPIPGQQGQQGIQGIAGGQGPPGLTIPPWEPDDGLDGPPMPGERGLKGDTGERGEAGSTIPPWEGDEPEQPLMILGPTGSQGERGLLGPSLAGEDGEDGLVFVVTIPGELVPVVMIQGPAGEDGEGAEGLLIPPGSTAPGNDLRTGAVAGSDVTVTSNTVPVDVTGISFPIAAGETVVCDINIRFVGSVGGMNFQLTGPSSPTSVCWLIGVEQILAFSSFTTGNYGSGTVTANIFTKLRIVNGANAGTVQLQFKSVTNLQTDTVKIGSFYWRFRV